MDGFDAIVVGSGFGGSVMAYELTQGMKTVCLLERGRAYPPGSFPRSPHQVSRNFWDPSEGYYGMFDVWAFRRMEALVASGLGGGSLIYANVLIRKPESWFVRENSSSRGYEYWPVTRTDLEPHYDAVETMLGGVPYPYGISPYDRTFKTRAMEQAAKDLGWQWMLPKLAITFAAEGESPRPGRYFHDSNLHQRDRVTCQLCGECDLGCNYGSKNTLDYNYLSRASETGRLDLRTSAEVRRIEPTSDGYIVAYVKHDREREGKKFNTAELPLNRIYARRLVLSAGALGSTYLLLRNRSAFGGIRDEALGSRFCTNGDLLTFVFRCRDSVSRCRTLDPTRGPVITSTMVFPESLDGVGGSRGYLLQDAGYGTFLSWLLEVGDSERVVRTARWLKRRMLAWITREPETEISGALGDLLGPCDLSSSSMPLLGMGRDIADGRMRLRRGRRPEQLYLDLDWRIARSKRHFNNVRDTSRLLARHLRGSFRENPSTRYLGRIITVHPLGGCPMGRHDREGVVDSYGQVFGHKGFYIADGSVMPGPVGTNPSLTIAALARRSAHHMLDEWPNAKTRHQESRSQAGSKERP